MRVYVALVRPEEGGTYLYVPIKRAGYPFAGMPQFFGGGVEEGETRKQALAREVTEESRGEYVYDRGNPLVRVHHGQVGGHDLLFFWTYNFMGHHTGDLDSGEMQSIRRVFLPEQDPAYSMQEFLESLGIGPSIAFLESETYIAFTKLIATFTA